MWDVLSGVSKMAWDVFSRDVLSYIQVKILLSENVGPEIIKLFPCSTQLSTTLSGS